MNKQNRNIQALIGHIVDIYRLITFNFENPHSYTKFRAIKSMAYKTKSQIFIETGTYLGVTTDRCAPFFEKVYTIELDEHLAKQATNFLSRRKNVEVIQGDALEVLADILQQQSTQNILIFLDGHFSCGETACGDFPEPAIEELRIISRYKDRVNVVIIDDFRCFGEHIGYPSKSSLLMACEEYFNDFKLRVYLDQVILIREETHVSVEHNMPISPVVASTN